MQTHAKGDSHSQEPQSPKGTLVPGRLAPFFNGGSPQDVSWSLRTHIRASVPQVILSGGVAEGLAGGSGGWKDREGKLRQAAANHTLSSFNQGAQSPQCLSDFFLWTQVLARAKSQEPPYLRTDLYSTHSMETMPAIFA